MQTSPAQIQKFLENVDYPAKKQDLIEQAKKHNASNEVLQDLNKTLDKEYSSFDDVSNEYKGVK